MKNLFRLSEEKEHFVKAQKEWFFTGEIIDHEQPVETCELCEHEALRYHYLIANDLGNNLWVGSKCIDKFDITVRDEVGNEITENKEAYLIKQARKKHIKGVFEKLLLIKPIGKMKGKNGEEFYKIKLDEWCKEQYLSGRQNARILNYLFVRFDEEGIFYEKSFFSIDLRSQENKDKLLKLSQTQFERIKPALSSSQRKYYEGNK